MSSPIGIREPVGRDRGTILNNEFGQMRSRFETTGTSSMPMCMFWRWDFGCLWTVSGCRYDTAFCSDFRRHWKRYKRASNRLK